jgi:hypothetical protein
MTADVTNKMRPEIEDRAGKFTRALQSSKLAADVLAVIVSGSAGRGEEIWSNGRLASDIDLMLVTRRTNPRLTHALAALMDPYRDDGIDGGPTPLTSLHRFRTLAFYEARATGVVVWGSHQLDELLPLVLPEDLPRWEAVRVLANRMFEHLKAMSGQAQPVGAAAKSYEALVEAGLTLEGRYRPSYRQRLTELTENPPSLLSPQACEAAIAVLRARLEHLPLRTPPADIARRDLLAGLHDALESYLEANGSLAELLALLARKERHWRHRLYWAMTKPRQASHPLRADPIIGLWQQAATALARPTTAGSARTLVDSWRACPQILHGAESPPAARTRISP